MTYLRNKIGLDACKRIVAEWPKATSCGDAMRRAGITATDQRTLRRYKTDAEYRLGVKLPPHNPQFSSEVENQCPSFLDFKQAKKRRAFVVSSATNNSRLHENFFATLELFCQYREAQLLIVPLKYRHNTLISRKDYTWPEQIYPYALNDDLILSKSIMVSGMPTVATAVNPLSGMGAHSGPRSAIYGATSLHLQMVPTPGDELPKMMQTTGSCTARTYTRSKAGGKARFHHVFAATFVQLVGSKFYHTQLLWDGKGFAFLDEYWTPDGLTTGHAAAAIIRGDDHAAMRDKAILAQRSRLCDRVKPAVHVFHDVFDGVSISHHHKLLDKIAVYRAGKHSLEWELEHTAKHVCETGGAENWIVDSNHDRHIERYLNEGRHLKDPHNAAIGSSLLAAIVETGKSALEIAFDKYIPGRFKFISANKRAMIKGIDLSQHGDRGPNGSRGSVKSFARSTSKSVVGHSHSPSIFQGAYQVGVSTMDMPYKVGLSTWACADCLIYENGKRAMLFYINGKSLADVV